MSYIRLHCKESEEYHAYERIQEVGPDTKIMTGTASTVPTNTVQVPITTGTVTDSG